MENNLKEKSSGRFYLLTIILLAVLIAVDHLTKHLAVVYLKGQPPIVLIKGTLELHYLENHGAAFGMLQNQQWLFAVLTVVFLVIAVWFFRKVPKTKKYLSLARKGRAIKLLYINYTFVCLGIKFLLSI